MALNQGIDLRRLTKIIVTHNDIDHMGALAAFKRAYPPIEIIASHLQAQYISGEQTTIRLQLARHAYRQARRTPPPCPDETDQYSDIRGNSGRGSTRERSGVDRCLRRTENDIYPRTSSRTYERISYGKPILIAGDALVSEFGKLEIAHQKSNLDSELARKSAMRLAELDIETIYCYHGGKYKGNIKEDLNSL
jgi:glyoxylase-like metal-dependent hydrolase (beta-lactamase superfamily II)